MRLCNIAAPATPCRRLGLQIATARPCQGSLSEIHFLLFVGSHETANRLDAHRPTSVQSTTRLVLLSHLTSDGPDRSH